MGFYELGVAIDTFEPDPDDLVRVRSYDIEHPVEIGQVVSFSDNESIGFARVVEFESDLDPIWVCLKELTGTEGEQAAKELELSYVEWCDPGND